MSLMENTVLSTLKVFRSTAAWSLVGADTAFMGTVSIGASALDPTGNLPNKVGKLWALMNMRLLGCELEVKGQSNIDADKPYVMMSNHQSHLDIWVMYSGMPTQFRWVMKQELRRIPIFGYACERMGHIYVQRGNRDNTRASMEEAARKIAAGTSVVFFPEGTRSPDGCLQAFKSGGFRLAIQAKVPILPVSMTGSRRILPAKSWNYTPGKVRMVIHRPIPTIDLSDEDLDWLMDETRRAILSGLPLEADGSPERAISDTGPAGASRHDMTGQSGTAAISRRFPDSD